MPTQLDHYRLLGKSGLRVSPLCLGTMTFGTEWGWGADEDGSRQQFDLYAEKGGNFIDTANYYTGGTSETYCGKFMKGRRDDFVLATKYTLGMKDGDPNAGGNHRKNFMRSLEASLKRLQTDYVDLYWLHMWDFTTPVEEVVRAFDDAVRQGKVLYCGFSDTPAWIVSQANTIAQFRGASPFVAYQVEYSLVERTPERDMLPMAEAFGMATAPWSPLAQGTLSGKYNKGDVEAGSRHEKSEGNKYKSERALKIAGVVIDVAEAIGRSPAQVALAWMLHDARVTSPIIGARKLEHVEDNLACLDIALSDEHMTQLNDASAIEVGFPHDFLAARGLKDRINGGTMIVDVHDRQIL
ncbi:MAG: aldo/keto reductase [Phycisphaerae bacterium]